MLFSSLTFILVFLPIVSALYFLSQKKYRNLILLIASLVFYAWGEPIYVVLMIVSIIVNYSLTLIMSKYQLNGEEKRTKTVLLSLIIFNIAIIGFFKYSNFLIQNINNLFGCEITSLNLALPIGISFYTFQIMSYVIDVYRKHVPPQKNFIKLATYIALFPQLIAGPIVRYIDINKQLDSREISFQDIIIGLKRFIIGLGKKVIIANQMAVIADTIYGMPIATTSGGLLWVAAIAYTFQIYFDFSGYSDMAIGLGQMFGFKFLENFNYPYIATSITDFWRRWHISLSSWFRDYVYIPLGGNRVAKWRWLINIMIVWSLTGLWHGAAWNFILWGTFYGILLIIEKLWLTKILEKIPKFFGWLYSMFIVLIGWVLFRVEGLENVIITIKQMFTSIDISGTVNVIANNYDIAIAIPFFILAIIGSFPLIKILVSKFDNKNCFFSIIINLFLVIIFYLVIILLLGATYNPFIYFRF